MQIALKLNNESMSLNEYTQWLCLIEAIQLIKAKNPTMTTYKKCAIRNYIVEKYGEIYSELEVDFSIKNLRKHRQDSMC